jgi:hypothetical protein
MEKTGKLVVKVWTQVKAGIDAGRLEMHKFKGSGKVVQNEIEKGTADQLLLALTGHCGVEERNLEQMLVAIRGDAGVDHVKPSQVGLALNQQRSD